MQTQHTTMKPQSKELTILIKLLKMTTSSHDHEALSAMRLANAQLLKLGTDWDDLISGRVTLVADPFTSVPDLKPSETFTTVYPSHSPSAPPPKGPPRPAPPRPPAYYTNAAAIQDCFDILEFVTLNSLDQQFVNAAERDFKLHNQLQVSEYNALYRLAMQHKPPKRPRRKRT